MNAVRTCVGCRQRRPLEELIGIVRADEASEGGAWRVVRLAGRPVRSLLTTKSEAVPNGGLVIDGDVAEGVHAGQSRPAKGWYACPDRRCLERALRAQEGRSKRGRGQPRTAQATGGRAGGTDGAVEAAQGVLQQAAGVTRSWMDARVNGLERRRVDLAGDARLDAWQMLARRLQAALRGAATG